MSFIKLGQTKEEITLSLGKGDKEGINKAGKEYLIYDSSDDLNPVTVLYFFDANNCNLIRMSYSRQREHEISKCLEKFERIEFNKIWIDKTQNHKYTLSCGDINEEPYSENSLFFNVDIQYNTN